MELSTYAYFGIAALIVIGYFFVAKHGSKAVLIYRLFSFGIFLVYFYIMLPYPSYKSPVVVEGTVDPERLNAYLEALEDELEETYSLLRNIMFLFAIIFLPIIYDVIKALESKETTNERADE